MTTDTASHRYDPMRPCIVVGIVADQPAEVLETAATFAERFAAQLVLAQIDDSRFTVEVRPDGEVVSMPIDPDLVTEDTPEVEPEILAELGKRLDGRNVQWSTRALAGAPSRQLHRLAEALDAAMIVIGVRRAGIRGSLHEFFNGSVALQLAHSQQRPLVVVPLRETATMRTEEA